MVVVVALAVTVLVRPPGMTGPGPPTWRTVKAQPLQSMAEYSVTVLRYEVVVLDRSILSKTSLVWTHALAVATAVLEVLAGTAAAELYQSVSKSYQMLLNGFTYTAVERMAAMLMIVVNPCILIEVILRCLSG